MSVVFSTAHAIRKRMSVRKAAVAAAIIMAVICLAPMLVDEDESEAVTKDDFKVSMPLWHTDETNYVTIGNGHSKTFVIYIQNFSDHIMDVAFLDISFSSAIHGSEIYNLTLKEAGDPDEEDLLKVEFTISVDELARSMKDVMLQLGIFVTDLTDDSTEGKTIRFAVTVKSSFDMSGSYNKFFGIIDNTLPAPFDTSITPFFVTLFAILGIALVVIRLMIPRLGTMMEERGQPGNTRRGKALLTLGVIIIALMIFMDPGLKILGIDIEWYYWLDKVSLTVLIIVLAVTLWKIYMIVSESMLYRLGKLEDSRIDLTLLPIFAMFGKLFLWIGGLAAILHLYGIDLSGILVSAGIVTLGITLGAQSVISQFFSGMSLLLTRPFSRGEYIELNGQTYIVSKVKLMYTEFFGIDQDRIITMPNNVVASATIVNLSKYDKAYRLYIGFTIPYGIDVKKAEDIMLQLAEESDHVLHDYERYKKPSVKLIEFQPSGVELRLEVTIKDYARMRAIQSDLKKELYVKLAENGIYAPFNRLDVTILNLDNEGNLKATVGLEAAPDKVPEGDGNLDKA